MAPTIREINVARRTRLLRLINRIMLAFFVLAGTTALLALGSPRFAVPVMLLAAVLAVSEYLVGRGALEAATVVTLCQIFVNVCLVVFVLPYENFLELYRYQTFMGAFLFVATLLATRRAQLLAAGGACFLVYNLGAWLKVVPGLDAGGGLHGAFISAYVAGNLGVLILTTVGATIWHVTTSLVGDADSHGEAVARRDALIRDSADKAAGGFAIGDRIQAVSNESDGLNLRASEALSAIAATLEEADREADIVSGALQSVERAGTVLAHELDRTSERSRQSGEGVRDILQEIAHIEERLATLMGRTRERRAGLPGRRAAVTEGTSRLQSVIEAVGELDAIGRLVADIAARTQVLAMNALIVAARSSGHGDQFAVVAREVQALAAEVESHTARIRAVTRDAGVAADGARAAGTEFESLYEIYAGDLEEIAAALDEVGFELQQITVGAGVIRLSVQELEQDTGESVTAMRQTERMLGEAAPALRSLSDSLAELRRRTDRAMESGERAREKTRSAAALSAEHVALLGDLVATITSNCDDVDGCIDDDRVSPAVGAAAPTHTIDADASRTRT